MYNKTVKTKYNRAGLTLIEVMVAMVIMGMTVAALVASSAAFTRTNAAGIDLSTAEFLIEEIRELTAPLPAVKPGTNPAPPSTFGRAADETSPGLCNDLDDFDNWMISPPVDVNGNPLPHFSNFTQKITVDSVNPNDLNQKVQDYGSNFLRIKVDILLNGQTISSASWIRVRMD